MSALSTSPVSLFRAYPRAIALQMSLLPAAIGGGGVIYSKLLLATQYLDGAVGLGEMGLMFSLSCGVAALFGGPLADRLSARWISGLSMMVTGISVALLGALMGRLSDAEIHLLTLIVVCMEGVSTGLAAASHPVVLAALVGPAHRGAADLINNVRVGLGVMVGMQLAQFLPSLHLGFLAGGAAFILAGVLILVVSPPTPGRQDSRSSVLSFRPVIQSLRNLPPLRRLVGTDLLLKVAIPSQLGSLYLADYKLESQAGLIFGAGLLGVLLGNLWLALAPPPAALSQSLRRHFSVYLLLALVAPFLLRDGWLLGVPWLAAFMLFMGSFVSTATESRVRAGVQQEVPDDIRGRISGTLGATRNVLSAIFGALHAVITQVADVSWLLVGLFIAGLMVWVFTRGFSIFGQHNPSEDVRA